jgi:hypothetical protein
MTMRAPSVLAVPAVLWVLSVFFPAPAVAQEGDTQRLQFKKGRSAAEAKGTIRIRDGFPETDTWLLRASAGQTMTVRLASPQPKAGFGVTCPGDGATDASGAEGKSWSFELPESGDYRVTVSGEYGVETSFPYTLEVGVTGKPHPVAPQGLTGTYGLIEDPDNAIQIRHLPDGRLRFHLLALWKGANWEQYGPNLGEAFGVIQLDKDRAVFREEGCTLGLTFTGDTVKIDQEGDCGFGHNVHAGGTYRRTSLCAAPEAVER